MKLIVNKLYRLKQYFSKSNINRVIESIGGAMEDFINKNKMFLVSISFLSGILFGAYFGDSYGSRKSDSYKDTISALTDSIRVIKIDKNTVASEKAAIELSLNDLKLISKSKDKNINDLVDAINKLKKRPGDVGFVSNVTASTSSVITVDKPVYIPCNSDTTVSFSDSILSADIIIKAKNGSMSIPAFWYEINMPLSVSLDYSGKVTVLTDKNIKITKLDSWVDPKLLNNNKKKWFSIGPQVGYGMTINGLSPYVGIGASINLIGF